MRKRGGQEQVIEEARKKGGAGDLLVTGACWGWRNSGEAEQRRSQAGDAAEELDAGSWGSGEVARFGNDGDDRLSCCSGWRGSEARELVLLGDGRLGA